MVTYIGLLRGINVGGRNRIRMADLRSCLTEVPAFDDVTTYIQSGNVVLNSSEPHESLVAALMEAALGECFDYQARVMVRSGEQLAATVAAAPPDFGNGEYRFDVIFCGDTVDPAQLVADLPCRKGVDTVWLGPDAVFSRRLAAEAGRSRLSRITTLPYYGDVTIRNWRTCTKLLQLANSRPW